MAQGYTDDIETVSQFLNDMKQILQKENFNIDNDFYSLAENTRDLSHGMNRPRQDVWM